MSACRHCGWELPPGALFCGECGRAVTAPALPPVEAVHAPAASAPGSADEAPPTDVPPPHPEAERVAEGGAEAELVGGAESEPVGPLSSFGREWDSWTSSSWDDAAVAARVADLGGGEPFEPTAPVREAPAVPADVASAPGGRAPSPPLLPVPQLPDADPPRSSPASGRDETVLDLESTRLVSRTPTSRHVLQFSTGESVTVTGSGLVGRNPGMEPGEYVDQLVTLVDGGRSVSKTHLEFGQEHGRFWISDRYSTNGTVVRPPDEPERRCEPGRRYLVSRGTRVDIGEQFFVVS
ncbi:MAG: FHA domain-containing protein [Micrococcales bacterium]|nr:FHA domain-containing protein [Micrococcales bacterium]